MAMDSAVVLWRCPLVARIGSGVYRDCRLMLIVYVCIYYVHVYHIPVCAYSTYKVAPVDTFKGKNTDNFFEKIFIFYYCYQRKRGLQT